MSKQYSWAEVREAAAEAFGGHYPDAELEQELLEVFRDRPAFVVDAVENVKRGFASGRIHSPWLLLRTQVQRPDSELVVSDEGERQRAIARARQWLGVAGLHLDRWSECEAHLFGPAEQTAPLEQLVALELETREAPGRYIYDGLLKSAIARTEQQGVAEIPGDVRGLLAAFDTPELREQMKAYYVEQRSRGLQAEQEELVRMQTYRSDRRRMRGDTPSEVANAPHPASGGSGEDWVGEEPPLASEAAPA